MRNANGEELVDITIYIIYSKQIALSQKQILGETRSYSNAFKFT